MAPVTTAQLRERITVLETELPHLKDDTKKANQLASKAQKDVDDLQLSFAGIKSELKQMREMLRRYLQIGSMLALAIVLNVSSGKIGEASGIVMKALAYALRHSF
jgi:FtsZ-binding cell division protein ZapB